MTAAKPKRGRPPLSPSERATWEAKLRLPRAEGKRVEKAATAAGVDVGVWLRGVVRAAIGR